MTQSAIFPDLKNKSVFITGGGSGIGASLTEGFLRQGAKTAFVDIAVDDSTKLVTTLEEKHGAPALFCHADITDTNALRDAIAKAADAHGPIDVLVNCAANDERKDWQDHTPDYWDGMMDINLKSYFFAMHAVAPSMAERGSGAIVNFSSISYMMGNAKYVSYTAANAGITAMTRTMARELGPDGVRVNAIAPGWVLTPKQIRDHGKPEDLARHLDRQCLKEHMKAEDIVDSVLFLSSASSRMMTGQCIAVDAGVVTVSA